MSFLSTEELTQFLSDGILFTSGMLLLLAMNLFEYSISSTSFSMQEKNENILKVRLQLVIL